MIDGLVTAIKRTVHVKSLNDIIEIHPFGDIHWDTNECDHEKFNSDIKEMKRSKIPLYLGMGDYLDYMAWGDRKKAQGAGFHSTTMQKLGKVGRKDITDFKDKISFMRGNLIGFIGGNHDWTFEDGRSGSEVLAEKMDAPFLGWISYIKLQLVSHGNCSNVDIVACHGKSGGKLAGTSINQVEDLIKVFPAADIYIMGHDHKRGGWPISRLFASSNARNNSISLKEKTQWLCRSGSYMRGYEVGTGGFVSQKTMPPTSLGKITIKIQCRRVEKVGCVSDFHPVIKVEA